MVSDYIKLKEVLFLKTVFFQNYFYKTVYKIKNKKQNQTAPQFSYKLSIKICTVFHKFNSQFLVKKLTIQLFCRGEDKCRKQVHSGDLCVV